VVPIPYGLRYRATARGQVPKLVRCEECGLEYVYVLEGTAEGAGSSFLFLDNQGAQERSQAAAAAALCATLEGGYDVVPCPACGRIQEHMIPRARREHRRWMNKLALAAFIVGGILFLPATIVGQLHEFAGGGPSWLPTAIWSAIAVLGVTAVGLPLLRLALAKHYDPNRAPVDERRRLGAEIAVSKEEFLKAAPGEPA
jgi:hypothetical protein